MKSPFYFLVEPKGERRYSNLSESGLITSVSKEDFKASNRYAVVTAVPNNYTGPIRPGDELIVHHNVFKFYNDMKGRERSGWSFIKDNEFMLEPGQFYMYKRDSKWTCHSKWCFVKPTGDDLRGVIAHINDNLKSMGLSVGDEISFKPDSEYEFEVDGEKMYRIEDSRITIKWT